MLVGIGQFKASCLVPSSGSVCSLVICDSRASGHRTTKSTKSASRTPAAACYSENRPLYVSCCKRRGSEPRERSSDLLKEELV